MLCNLLKPSLLVRTPQLFKCDVRLFCSKATVDQGKLPKRLKNAIKGTSPSSTNWLRRQLTDPYVRKAHEEGLPSRAAFKLSLLDDKHKFLHPGYTVIDLGASPGGWSVIASERVHAPLGGIETEETKTIKNKGMVISVDIQELVYLKGPHVITGDFLEESTVAKINSILNGRKVDVLLSDMAPSASGQRQADHDQLVVLNEAALAFACQVLRDGGTFLVKCSRGGDEHNVKKSLQEHFKTVQYAKPDASRKDSAEIFLFAQGFNRKK